MKKFKASDFDFEESSATDSADGLETADYDFCCGVTEVGNFYDSSLSFVVRELQWDYESQHDDWYYQEDKRVCCVLPSRAFFVKGVLKMLAERLDTLLELKQGRIYSAVLVANQLWMKPALLKCGFRLVSDRTVNRNTQNRLYFFLRDPVTPKGSNLKKRKFR